MTTTSPSDILRESFRGVFVIGPVLADKNLSANAKLVYAALMSFDGERGCFPKLTQLAEALGANVSTVRRAIRQLEDEEFIQVKRPTGKDLWRHLHTSYYFMPLTKTEHLAHARTHRVGKTGTRTSVQNEHSNECAKPAPVTPIRSIAIRSIQEETRADARDIPPTEEEINSFMKEQGSTW